MKSACALQKARSQVKFKIIYADPPWQYEQKSLSGAAAKHYATLTDDELYQLPIQDIADEDCILILWVTYPKLKEALELMHRWGFAYKTIGFVWLKQNKKSLSWFFGMGFWTRGNTEICLLATKGKPKRISAKVSQLVVSPMERHSKKPDEVRQRIEQLLGEVTRVELFARQRYDGWECLGNEIDGLDIREALQRLKEREG